MDVSGKVLTGAVALCVTAAAWATSTVVTTKERVALLETRVAEFKESQVATRQELRELRREVSELTRAVDRLAASNEVARKTK
jgi:septal ring factor EnvC (AmiA/AmiB activator)